MRQLFSNFAMWHPGHGPVMVDFQFDTGSGDPVDVIVSMAGMLITFDNRLGQYSACKEDCVALVERVLAMRTEQVLAKQAATASVGR